MHFNLFTITCYFSCMESNSVTGISQTFLWSTFIAAQKLSEMGRYTWHPNELCKAVADKASTGLQLAKRQLPARCSTTFIWAGKKLPYQRKTSVGSLALAHDLRQKVGLLTHLKFSTTHCHRTQARLGFNHWRQGHRNHPSLQEQTKLQIQFLMPSLPKCKMNDTNYSTK